MIVGRAPGFASGGEFTVEDGVQPPLHLVSAERDLLAATFTKLLLANCGGEDTFKVQCTVLVFITRIACRGIGVPV